MTPLPSCRRRRSRPAHGFAVNSHASYGRSAAAPTLLVQKGLHLGVGEDLVNGVHRRTGHSHRFQRRHPGRGGTGTSDGFDLRDELAPVAHPQRVAGQARIGEKLRRLSDRAETLEQTIVVGRDDDEPIFGRKYLLGHRVGLRAAQALSDLSADDVVGGNVGEPGDLHVQAPHVHALPPAPPPLSS